MEDAGLVSPAGGPRVELSALLGQVMASPHPLRPVNRWRTHRALQIFREFQKQGFGFYLFYSMCWIISLIEATVYSQILFVCACVMNRFREV